MSLGSWTQTRIVYRTQLFLVQAAWRKIYSRINIAWFLELHKHKIVVHYLYLLEHSTKYLEIIRNENTSLYNVV
jgi:hypothetical protein